MNRYLYRLTPRSGEIGQLIENGLISLLSLERFGHLGEKVFGRQSCPAFSGYTLIRRFGEKDSRELAGTGTVQSLNVDLSAAKAHI